MRSDDPDAHDLACWMIDRYGAAASDRTEEIAKAHRDAGTSSELWEKIATAVKAILTGHRNEHRRSGSSPPSSSWI